MVGQAPELLEPRGRDSINKDKLETEISKFLRLHHDYSAKPLDTVKAPKKTVKTNRNSTFFSNIPNKSHTKTKLKTLRPKMKKEVPKSIAPKPVIHSSEIVADEVVYGTYDEANNCITIIVNNDELNLDNSVAEVITISDDDEIVSTEQLAPVKVEPIDNNYLSVPSITSPSYNLGSDGSDYGYESASPRSSINDMDLWDQSISELFPSLV